MTYSEIRLVQQLAAIVMVLGCAKVTAQDLAVLPETASRHDDTQEKIELGKKLYFDPRRSATGTVSCNSCDNLMEGVDDGRLTSLGVDGLTGPPNAPRVWNSAFQASQFWDGRSTTLEKRAKGPMVADFEMGMLGHSEEYLGSSGKQVSSFAAKERKTHSFAAKGDNK